MIMIMDGKRQLQRLSPTTNARTKKGNDVRITLL